MERNLENLWTKYCSSNDELETEHRLASLLNAVQPLIRNEKINQCEYWTRNETKITETILKDFSHKIKRFIDANVETESNDSFYTSYSQFHKSAESFVHSSIDSGTSDAETEGSLVVNLSLGRLSFSDSSSDGHVSTSPERQFETGSTSEIRSSCSGIETSRTESCHHDGGGETCDIPNGRNSSSSIRSLESPGIWSFTTAPSGSFLTESISTEGTIIAEERNSSRNSKLSQNSCSLQQITTELSRLDKLTDCYEKDSSSSRHILPQGVSPKGGPLLKDYRGKLAGFQDYILAGNGSQLLILLNQNTSHQILAKQCELVELLCCLVPYIISELPEEYSKTSSQLSSKNISAENIFHHLMNQPGIKVEMKNFKKPHKRKPPRLNKRARHLSHDTSSSEDIPGRHCRRGRSLKEVKAYRKQTKLFLRLNHYDTEEPLTMLDCLQIIFSIVAQHLCCETTFSLGINRHSNCAAQILRFGLELMTKVRVSDMTSAGFDRIVHGLVLIVSCGCRYFLENSKFESLKNTRALEILSRLLDKLVNCGMTGNPKLRTHLTGNIIFISSVIICVMRTIHSVRQEDTSNCLQKYRYLVSLGVTDSVKKSFRMLQLTNEEGAKRLFNLIVSLIVHVKTWRADMVHGMNCRRWRHAECKHLCQENHHVASFGESTCALILLGSNPSSECLVSYFYQFALGCLHYCRDAGFLKVTLNLLFKTDFCCCLPLSRVISPLLDAACSSPANVQSLLLCFIETSIFRRGSQWCWSVSDVCDITDSFGTKENTSNSHNDQISSMKYIDVNYDLSFYYDHLLSPDHGNVISSHLAKVSRYGLKELNVLLFRQLIQPAIAHCLQVYPKLQEKKLVSVANNLMECLWVLFVFNAEGNDVYEFIVANGRSVLKLCPLSADTNKGSCLRKYLVYFELRPEVEAEKSNSGVPVSSQNVDLQRSDHSTKEKFFADLFIDELQKLCRTWHTYFNNVPTRTTPQPSHIGLETADSVTGFPFSQSREGVVPHDSQTGADGCSNRCNFEDEVQDSVASPASFDSLSHFERSTESEISPLQNVVMEANGINIKCLSHDSILPAFDKLVELWDSAAQMARECAEFHSYRHTETLRCAKYFLLSILHHLAGNSTGNDCNEFRRNFSATCILLRSLLTVVLILSDSEDKKTILVEVVNLIGRWDVPSCVDLPKLIRELKDCSCIEKTWIKAAELFLKCKKMFSLSRTHEVSDGYDLESEICSDDSSEDEIRRKYDSGYIFAPQLATLALDIIILAEKSHRHSNSYNSPMDVTVTESGEPKVKYESGPTFEDSESTLCDSESLNGERVCGNQFDILQNADQTLHHEGNLNDSSREVNKSNDDDSESNHEGSDTNRNLNNVKLDSSNSYESGVISSNYVATAEEHFSAITQCLKILLSLCKISEQMCKLLYREGFLAKILQGFEDILTQNHPGYQDSVTTIVDLWYEVGQWETSNHDICNLLGLFKSSNPPADILIRTLERLMKTVGEEPFFYVRFAKSKRKSSPIHHRKVVRNPVDFAGTKTVFSLHRKYKDEGLSSCLSCSSIVCPIHRTVDWAPASDGFSVFAWICFNERQTVKRHSGRYSEYASSTPRPTFGKRNSFRYNFASGRSTPDDKSISIDDYHHILSIGHLSAIFGLWFNTKNGLLSIQVSNELNRTRVHEDQFESSRLKQIGWHSVAMRVPKHQHRNVFITISVIVDGIEEMKLNTQIPEQRNKRTPSPNLLIIGQNDVAGYNEEDNPGSIPIHIGNVFLFRSDLLTHEPTMVLHHLGINNHNLCDISSNDSSFLIVIKPVFLRLGVNLSTLCKDLTPLILPLKMNLIATYLPENPHEYQCYSSQSPYFTDMSSVSYPVCEHLEPILFGSVHVFENKNLEAAIMKMGGMSQMMFLAARVVELRCDEALVSKVIGLLIQLVQKVLVCRQQLHGLGGLSLVFRLFKNPFVTCEAIVLKEILESCISQPVICYHPRKGCYFMSAYTNGVITDLKIFEELLDNWRYFCWSNDDNIKSYECIDADGTTGLTNVGIILSSIRCLVTDDSSYRLFNLAMLRKIKTLQKLLSIFEEVKAEHRSVDGLCQPELLVRVILLLMCVGSPETANRSPLHVSTFDFEESPDWFHERDLNKCGLLKPVISMNDLRCVVHFLLLLNPDEATYVSIEEKHAFYLSQQHLAKESTRLGSDFMVHLVDGTRVVSSKFWPVGNKNGNFSYEPGPQSSVENAVEAIAGASFSEESSRKLKPRTKKLSVSSLLSFSIPEEAEWDINEVNQLADSCPETLTDSCDEVGLNNVGCHSVLVAGLLEVVQDVVKSLSPAVDCSTLDHCCSLNLILTLCGNSCPAVRAAAVNVFGILLSRLERDGLQMVLKRNVLHLLSHQLFRHASITEELLNAVFTLALRTPFDLVSGYGDSFKFRDHYPLKMFIPLLSVLPTSTSDIVLCHNALSALYRILRKNEAHMLRFFYKSHCLDSLILTLYRCVHTNDGSVSDLTGESQSQIIIGDVTEMLCFFVNIFVAYPVNQSYVAFCDLEAQINLLARSELQKCGAKSKCAQSLLEVEAKLLETSILRLAVVSLSVQSNSRSDSITSEAASTTDPGGEKFSNFCDSEVLNLLSQHLTKEMFAEDAGIESSPIPATLINRRESGKCQMDTRTVNRLVSTFRRTSDAALDRNILADRFKSVLQKTIDLMFLIGPIAKDMEKRCIDKYAISLVQFLATSLQCVIKASQLEPMQPGKKSGFFNLVWMCQDILWNHYCNLITLLMSPLMVEGTREKCLGVAVRSLHLLQLAISFSRKQKLMLCKFAIFLHEFMSNAKGLAPQVYNSCSDVLSVLKAGGVSVLPPPEQGFEEWSVVGQETALWLEEVLRMASFIRQRNSSHDERLRTNYANFFDEVAEEGTRVTMKVAELQNGRRKCAFRSIKKAQCRNIRNVHAWRNIIETLSHERANWHFPEGAPRGWILDETEGPNRIRRRLKRCHLKIDPKLFQPQFAPLQDTKESGQPLAFLLQCDEADAVFSQTVESINNDENLIYMGGAALITMTVHQNGELLISGKHIYFIGGECYSVDGVPMPGVVSKYWSAETIYEIHPRRYELRDCALEIFSTTNDSIMLAFDSQHERNKVNQILHKIYMPNLVEKMSTSQATQLWRHGQITNFDYLTHLNKLAGRTLNDLMQYPVFPFVLSNYDSDQVDLADPSIYRNLSKAVSVQNPSREEGFKEHYKETEQMCPDGPYHYNSHYSNSVIVLYYMIRMPPFTHLFLKFQGKKFDAPDRTFYSLRSTWQLASAESNTAMRELIPEFYYMPELFTNSQGFELGFRQNGQQVNDIELPPWADGDPRKFVFVHRAMLESAFVTKNLPIWIDLIFGYKQTGKEAVDAVNVFHPATYFGFDVEGGGDELTINARKTMIRTYGQTPRQLFSSSHPSANTGSYQYLKTADADGKMFPKFKNIPLGIFAGSVGEKGIHVSYCMTLPHHVSAMKTLSDGEVILLPQNLLACVFKMSQAFSIFYTISWRASDGVLRCKRQRNATILPLTAFSSHNEVTCCASSGKQLWCGTKSGLIFVFLISPFEGKGDLVTNPSQLPLIAHSKAINCVVISEEFKVTLSAGDDGTVVIWDYNKHTYVNSVTLDADPTMSKLVISPTLGDWVSVTHQESTSSLRYYSINAECLGKVDTPAKVADVVFSSAPEGRSVNVFAAALQNGTISLYSTWTMENLRNIPMQNNQDPLTCLFFTPNSQQLVVITESKRLYVCDSILAKTKPLKFIVVDPF